MAVGFGVWCPGRDLNPHFPFEKTDFKSVASADFATRAKQPYCKAEEGVVRKNTVG